MASASSKSTLIKQAALCFMVQEDKTPQRLTEISGNKYKGGSMSNSFSCQPLRKLEMGSE